jgi:glycosyltransferase involved in cell wall biosynthesis
VQLRSNTAKVRVVIYSPFLARLWCRPPTGMVGGAEVQLDRLACAIAGRLPVHCVTLNPGCAAWQPPEGVGVTALPPRKRSVLGTLDAGGRLAMALWRVPADAVVQRGSSPETLVVAVMSRLRGRRFVYAWASDIDRRGDTDGFGGRFGALLYRWGRSMAHCQVCQTPAQLASLPARQRRKAFVIPNMAPPPRPERTRGSCVVWVGSVKPEYKRPLLVFDVAARLPTARFLIVGDLRGDLQFQSRFRQALAETPNVTYAGFVAPLQMDRIWAEAAVLLNTSTVEGFPNVFLEAWAWGVPVVTAGVDPEGLVSNGLGRVATADPDSLASAIARTLRDGPPNGFAARARDIVETRGEQGLAKAWVAVLGGVDLEAA